MTRKRTYKPKPVEVVDEFWDAEESLELPEEPQEELEQQPEVIEKPSLHLVSEGENIQSIAALYLPEGMTRKDYARDLYQRNGDAHVGKLIHL
jgi:hypothetical protein